MKHVSILVAIFIFTLFSTAVLSEVKRDKTETAITVSDFQKIRDDIKEIRRDQLNYKIEKDLLKETYSTNYQTINLMISLALAFFGIMGYFGFKSISESKKEYIGELDKLREIKNDFESKLKELVATQSDVRNKISSITTINEEQSVKIKNLELKEKVGALMTKKEYHRALEYIAVGLDVKKDDAELLSLKVDCYLRLGNYREAIDTINKILSIDPDDLYSLETLAELYLFTENIDSYDELVKGKKDVFILDAEAAIEYLEALKHYVKNDMESLTNLIKVCVNKHDLSSTTSLIGWDFRDVRVFVQSKKEDAAKKVLIGFTQYLEGKLMGQNLLKLIDDYSGPLRPNLAP